MLTEFHIIWWARKLYEDEMSAGSFASMVLTFSPSCILYQAVSVEIKILNYCVIPHINLWWCAFHIAVMTILNKNGTAHCYLAEFYTYCIVFELHYNNCAIVFTSIVCIVIPRHTPQHSSQCYLKNFCLLSLNHKFLTVGCMLFQ